MALKDFRYRVNKNNVTIGDSTFDTPEFRVTWVIYNAEEMMANVALKVNEKDDVTIDLQVTEEQEGITAQHVDSVLALVFPDLERIDE